MDGRRGTWPWVAILAVAACAVGLVVGSPVLVHVAYLLCFLLALCPLYAWLSLRAIRLEYRVALIRVFVGERVLEVFRLRAHTLWPVFGVDVVVCSGVTPEWPRWAVALAPRGHEELAHVAVAAARGRYPVGAVAVLVADPFGLVVARRLVAATSEVVVWPRSRIIPDFTLAAARAGDLLPARRSWASMPVSGAVRPFVQGDPSTRIHWLSSVRHGSLMVKNSDQAVGQRLWVALDLVDSAHAGSGAESTVEYGVEAAAYVVELSFKVGLDVGLVVAGAATRIAEPRRGRDQREHLRDLLAEAWPGAGESLVATLDGYRIVRPSDAVVMVTPGVSPALLEFCARLRRLGCGVAVVLLDAAAFGGAGVLPDDVAALEAEHIPIYRLNRDGAPGATTRRQG